jgi:hypothetical protein
LSPHPEKNDEKKKKIRATKPFCQLFLSPADIAVSFRGLSWARLPQIPKNSVRRFDPKENHPKENHHPKENGYKKRRKVVEESLCFTIGDRARFPLFRSGLSLSPLLAPPNVDLGLRRQGRSCFELLLFDELDAAALVAESPRQQPASSSRRQELDADDESSCRFRRCRRPFESRSFGRSCRLFSRLGSRPERSSTS